MSAVGFGLFQLGVFRYGAQGRTDALRRGNFQQNFRHHLNNFYILAFTLVKCFAFHDAVDIRFSDQSNTYAFFPEDEWYVATLSPQTQSPG